MNHVRAIAHLDERAILADGTCALRHVLDGMRIASSDAPPPAEKVLNMMKDIVYALEAKTGSVNDVEDETCTAQITKCYNEVYDWGRFGPCCALELQHCFERRSLRRLLGPR